MCGTCANDRTTKLALYARHGLPELWIVDLDGAALEVYREPAGNGYARSERLAAGSVHPKLASAIAIDVAALFG